MPNLDAWSPRMLSVLRIVIGLLFMEHGLMKLLHFPAPQPGETDPLPPLLLAAGWIETVGGGLIALGLLTRAAAFICSGEMAVAYFMIHVTNAATPMAKFFPISSAGPQFSNKGELAIFYCWFFLFVVFYGAGRWSIDAMIGKGKAAVPTP